MATKEIDLIEYFKLLTKKHLEEDYKELFLGLRRIQEELNSIGLLRSGELIQRTLLFIESQVIETLNKVIMELSTFSNEISLLSDQEIEKIKANLIQDFTSMIIGIMDERKQVITKLALDYDIMDHCSRIVTNIGDLVNQEFTLLKTVNKIKTRDKNSKARIEFIKYILPLIISIISLIISLTANYDKIKNFFK
ncbi:hypothetical protein SAMN04487897_11657 [Paenibacillus sp. yr247]|uniref:hypothetical protein n=1 Tax=Paenibacillus sp. yr247 TaxID=1761880 RepID=UPI000887F772|nr:hypothetical protein [Paenibacillus sp. yr247]SDO53747.1 hypothetical protein SAMN04487897_11657 [Paenibacillus sp. yr247]